MYSHLSKLLKEREKSFIPEENPPLEVAAVLVLLHQQEGEDHLLLTQRTETVAHHKGQICFPGGVRDPKDADLWTTALRETEEEIGILPKAVSYIGALDPMITPTGFQVFPFVGALNQEFKVFPSPHEIAEVFSVPLAHLLNPQNLKLVHRSYAHLESSGRLPQEFRKFLSQGYDDPTFVYRSHEIWGVTARILMQLIEIIR